VAALEMNQTAIPTRSNTGARVVNISGDIKLKSPEKGEARSMATISTSKVNVAPGGITSPAPLLPSKT